MVRVATLGQIQACIIQKMFKMVPVELFSSMRQALASLCKTNCIQLTRKSDNGFCIHRKIIWKTGIHAKYVIFLKNLQILLSAQTVLLVTIVHLGARLSQGRPQYHVTKGRTTQTRRPRQNSIVTSVRQDTHVMVSVCQTTRYCVKWVRNSLCF